MEAHIKYYGKLKEVNEWFYKTDKEVPEFYIKSYEVIDDVGSLTDDEVLNGTWNINMFIRYMECPKKISEKKVFHNMKEIQKEIQKLSKMEKQGKPHVRIISLEGYTIPTYGNKRCLPYGNLTVTDGNITRTVKIQDGDASVNYMQFFTFNRHRYYVQNVGGLYNPCFKILDD